MGKNKFFGDNSLKFLMFCFTGLAVVFGWTLLPDNVPFARRYEYLNIVSYVINVGILVGMLIISYFANRKTKEEHLLPILKDAQIIMERDNY